MRSDDALSTQHMNVRPGEKQPIMRATVFNVEVQQMVLLDGRPKMVLQERGLTHQHTYITLQMGPGLLCPEDCRLPWIEVWILKLPVSYDWQWSGKTAVRCLVSYGSAVQCSHRVLVLNCVARAVEARLLRVWA